MQPTTGETPGSAIPGTGSSWNRPSRPMLIGYGSLLTLQLLVILGLLRLGLRGDFEGPPPPAPRRSTEPAPSRGGKLGDPQQYLPLSGMAGAKVGDPDACRRMVHFFSACTQALAEKGVMAPHDPGLVARAATSGRCGVDSPAVAEALDQLRPVWRSAGMPNFEPL